jgi:CYTH domain-containing protein
MPPAWFGREVTGRPEYANRSLSVDGLPPVDDA